MVKPGGNPDDIREQYRGADSLFVDVEGGLEIKAGSIMLRQPRPYTFQEDREVSSHYSPNDNDLHTVGYQIGDYDASKTLVIDPLVFSTLIGGNEDDETSFMTKDHEGNLIVTGFTLSPDFPTTPGAANRTYQGNRDVFVYKLSGDGRELIYATYVGGSEDDRPRERIAVDKSGNVYITGRTYSADFPTTPGAYNRTLQGKTDLFAFKLAANGTELLYSTLIGGNMTDTTHGAVLDGQGNLYVSGTTESENFPTTPGAFDRVNNGTFDIFVLKLNPQGSDLVFSTFVGGDQYDDTRDIGLDRRGNVYVCGNTKSTNFPVTENAFKNFSMGNSRQAILFKLNASGASLDYSTYLGGDQQDNWAFALKVDEMGRAYVMGDTRANDFPVTNGSYDTSHNGEKDLFILRMNASGTGLDFSTYLGGSQIDHAQDLHLAANGNIMVSATSSSPDLETTPDAFQKNFEGVRDSTLFIFNHNLSKLEYGTYLGTDADEWQAQFELVLDEDLYLAGKTYSRNFPVTDWSHHGEFAGVADTFLVRLQLNNTRPTVNFTSLPSSVVDRGQFLNANISTQDPDDIVVAYHWSSSIDGFLNGEVNLSITNLSVGHHTIYLRVQDARELWSHTISFNVTVNDPPTPSFKVIQSQTIDEGELVDLIGEGSDTDGDVLAYQWVSSLIGEASNNTRLDTSLLMVGNHSLSFRVKDDRNSWSKWIETWLLVNGRPLAGVVTLPPGILDLGSLLEVMGVGNDNDGNVTAYRWSSSLMGVLSNQALLITDQLIRGQHTITFQVQDDRSAWSEPLSFILVVNDLPGAHINTLASHVINHQQTISFSGYGVDTEGPVTAYRWSSSLEGFLSDMPGFSLNNLSVGQHTIQLRVQDANGTWSPPASVSVVVNGYPSALLEPGFPNLVQEGQPFLLPGNWSDEDGVVINHRWRSSLEGELGNNLSQEQVRLGPGDHIIYFSVQDDRLAWSPEVQFALEVNRRPTTQIMGPPSGQMAIGSDLELTSQSEDGDGMVVRFHWSSDLAGELGESQEQDLKDLPAGHHNIILRVVDDQEGQSLPAKFELWVYAPPTLELPAVVKGKINKAVSFSGQAQDLDGNVVQYEWDFDGDGTFDWSSSIGPQTNFTYEKPGNFTATLRVTDNDGFNATASHYVLIKRKEESQYGWMLTLSAYLFVMASVVTLMGYSTYSVIRRNENNFFYFLPVLFGLTRWRDEDIMANQTRGQILGVIKALPGIIMTDIKEKVGIHDGVAAYHLYVLEREGMIKSEASPYDKRARCFYPTDQKVQGPFYRLTQIQLEIVEHLAENPGNTTREMVEMLKNMDGQRYKRQTIEYNLKRLWKSGCLKRVKGQDRTYHWYIIQKNLPELFNGREKEQVEKDQVQNT